MARLTYGAIKPRGIAPAGGDYGWLQNCCIEEKAIILQKNGKRVTLHRATRFCCVITVFSSLIKWRKASKG